PPAGPPFKALQTFTADGGTVQSEIVFVSPAPSPPSVTEGHGAWVRTGHRAFSATLMLLRRDEHGTLVGSVKVVMHITLDRTGDAWSSVNTVSILSPAGTVLTSRTDLETATRIRAEGHHEDRSQED
ncbi:MAG: hypothetical protein M3336_17505, partial [Chloroflexota bacterium]|nr:hypothetical protein [Chloroflexota bacterium]